MTMTPILEITSSEINLARAKPTSVHRRARHVDMHEHFRICVNACRACEHVCGDQLTTMS
jgi:hypothetical protein